MKIYQKIIALFANGRRQSAFKYIQPAYEKNKITKQQYEFLLSLYQQEEN